MWWWWWWWWWSSSKRRKKNNTCCFEFTSIALGACDIDRPRHWSMSSYALQMAWRSPAFSALLFRRLVEITTAQKPYSLLYIVIFLQLRFSSLTTTQLLALCLARASQQTGSLCQRFGDGRGTPQRLCPKYRHGTLPERDWAVKPEI